MFPVLALKVLRLGKPFHPGMTRHRPLKNRLGLELESLSLKPIRDTASVLEAALC